MNTFMHGPSFFSFHFFSFSISFPKLTILPFYVSTWLADVENHWTHLRDIELKTDRKIPYFRFPMYYSLYNWIAEHEITKLRKKIFASNPEKRTQKQTQKDMNEMEWHKMDYLIYSEMRMRKRYLFCTSSHHNVPYEEQQEFNKGSEPWNEYPF